MQGGERYNSISDHLKSEFGRKTVKLSIDAGFTCPNRDGTAGYGGCAFCSEGGSGELAAHASSSDTDYSASISDQIGRLSEKWPDACYLAYFQSFTNTYAPVDVLRSRYYAALDDPRISGTYAVTRADVTRDLRWAKVYVSVLEEDKADDMIKALKKAAGYIRHELGLRVDLRYTPELLFERDRNIAYGAHIAQVLRDVIPQETEAQGEENGDGKTE